MTHTFSINRKGEIVEVMVDAEDAPKIETFNWYANDRYAYATIDGKTTYLHRFLMDAPKGFHVDHIDGNGFNNTKINLRIATPAQNARNASKKRNSDLPKGVGVIKGSKTNPYCAQITINFKKIHLGSFPTPEEAHEAYCLKAQELFGEFYNPGTDTY